MTLGPGQRDAVEDDNAIPELLRVRAFEKKAVGCMGYGQESQQRGWEEHLWQDYFLAQLDKEEMGREAGSLQCRPSTGEFQEPRLENLQYQLEEGQIAE